MINPLQNASDDVKALNRDKFPGPVPGEVRSQYMSSEEHLFQADFEMWLTWRGYRRRSDKHIQSAEGQTGLWFVHVHRAQKNPILADLILLDANRGRYIEIELKVEGGALTPNQKHLEARGEIEVAWNMEQAQKIVIEWEGR
ncbi:MAG: hypothetical protein GY820_39865 [Gammaproteobacteria bacterium]|nr:hypothetical protein [Gammaproteobacteria bacterium]